MTISDNMNLNEVNITASMYLKSEAQSSFFLIYVIFCCCFCFIFLLSLFLLSLYMSAWPSG